MSEISSITGNHPQVFFNRTGPFPTDTYFPMAQMAARSAINPTGASVAMAPTSAPVATAPSAARFAMAPTGAPVAMASTAAPVSMAPSVARFAMAPTGAPVAMASTTAPVAKKAVTAARAAKMATDATATLTATLEENFNKAINEKEDIEKKIKQSTLLNEKLSTLRASDNFISPKGLMELRTEIKTDETLISKSSALHFKIENLERQTWLMRNSDDCINLQDQQQLQEEINVAKEKLEKAISINAKMSYIERNPDFLPPLGIEQLKEELCRVNSIFQNISLQGPSMEAGLDAILRVQTEARDELECIICLDVPSQGVPVFSCLEHHLLCSDCAKQILQSCPVCRQNFRETPPTRNRLAEKMIERLS
jgi:hypothetical protein